MTWIKSQVRFQQPPSQAAFPDDVREVQHSPGMVSSKSSGGGRIQRGGITKHATRTSGR